MQRIGIGYEYYKDFLDHNLYYVDKTLLIKDVIDFGGAVTLFTRPRRFGKTLALSMLRTFFEEERDRDGNIVDNSRYFSGKKIMDCGDPEILSMMGKYPVIKLSLKSAKQPDFKTAIQKLSEEIAGEFRRHRYLESSDRIDPSLKNKFLDLYLGAGDSDDPGKYSTALKTLSECLYEHHGKKVIILLDEYDVPLENAWYSGFYDEMVGFIRSLFESALKTNDALERAVITGCLRISKESIFTGLNHLMVNSIRGEDFGEYFGFTQAETEQMLIDYGLFEKIGEVREWYDGYLFGDSDVYNPWSVINYVANHRRNHDRFPEPYWSNTSSNTIIRELVENSTPE
ncbi:MAG: AAA family ATPase, partial [Lachnospiraceae bacterium]|nr:AAA family ATPase [Lachnospiraceae bacterium]